MKCGFIKPLAGALIKYCFLAQTLLINSCNGCDPRACVHYLSTLKIPSLIELPESGEFLKALGFATGVVVVIAGIKELQKILVEIDKQDRKRQKDALQLPDTLYERINHRIVNLDKKIKQEILQRERLLTLRYPQEPQQKSLYCPEPICLEEQFYDRTLDTGCSILDLPKHRERSGRT